MTNDGLANDRPSTVDASLLDDGDAMGCASSAPARDDAASSSCADLAVPTLEDGSVNVEATLKTLGIAHDANGDEDATTMTTTTTTTRTEDGGGARRRSRSLRSTDAATARRTTSLNGRRSAQALGELASAKMSSSTSARLVASPRKDVGRSSGTTTTVMKGGAFGRSSSGGRVDAPSGRERKDGATTASEAAHEFEKRPGRRQEGGSDGLPPMAFSARSTPHSSRNVGVEHGERDERGGRPSMSKFRGDEQAATKDVKGPSWVPPTKGSTIVAQARKRTMHKRTMSEDPGTWGSGTFSTPTRTSSGLRSMEEAIFELDGHYEDAALTPEEFSHQVQSLMRSMRERQAFLRKITMETIELCKPLVELEAPIEALLRLQEIDEAAMARDADEERERLLERDLVEPEVPSHAKTRTFSQESFEISSALSAYDFERRASARGDSEFSLDGIEEELRSVDELLKETNAVGA